MKRLDRYIVGKFLHLRVHAWGVLLVVVVFDLMEHLGRLLDHQAPVLDTAGITSMCAFTLRRC